MFSDDVTFDVDIFVIIEENEQYFDWLSVIYYNHFLITITCLVVENDDITVKLTIVSFRRLESRKSMFSFMWL